ncbi:MAG: hypothetical protein ACMVP2_07920 [Imperialibacter sp.]|uniref:hypothetical protein n=1 Tax=Imperialibacter sp. TaxID=2038411 RepID=UPI003A88B6C4
MKKVLIIICLVAFNGILMAQSTVSDHSKVDALFEKRTALLENGESTRVIDHELAKLGVRFPAKLNVSYSGDKINIAFPLLENSNAAYMEQKIVRIKAKMPELEVLGIEASYCFATFKKNASEKQLTELLSEFLYDGYYVSAHSRVQVGALMD